MESWGNIHDTKAKVLLGFRSYCKGDRKVRTKPRGNKAVDGRLRNKCSGIKQGASGIVGGALHGCGIGRKPSGEDKLFRNS